nr:MAG TPA: hypothetical protein [Bacteriophage sp.]
MICFVTTATQMNRLIIRLLDMKMLAYYTKSQKTLWRC